MLRTNKMKLDEKDHNIIAELIKDGRKSTSKLAKKLNIPITTVHNHIKKLEKEKVILNYTVKLDYKKLGQPILANVGITVNYQAAGQGKLLSQVDVAKEIKKIDGVQEVTIMTGGHDILVKLLARDIMHLNRMVTEQMRKVVGVDKTQTSIVLMEV